MNADTPLDEAARLVKKELPSYLGDGFAIAQVMANSFNFEDEELNLIHVYLEPGHPRIEPQTVARFDLDMETRFAEMGLSSRPAISYGVAG